ncbi:DUF2382 domain-containing protein [Saccharothrix syringae]|uniref:Uncharacterized protein n=1 Tax=Saccharothrix syringae TaxID=103733 RepID=A0A5Q0GS02_SACSY|nr:DUF2382 domain-containing protein [Saccharothrix syringae]QFZ16651.1 hypothetical protein EKG83_03455 [Saccharothrix syringae]
MTNVLERATHWHHREVLDPNGDKIGTVEQVWFADDDSGPGRVSVNTGLFGLRRSFLPIRGLTEGPGGELRTPYREDQVKDAPNVDASDDHLDSDEERRLYDHYGLGAGQRQAGTTDHGTARHAARDTARDTVARHRADHATTRSEEHPRVGAERREAGRARLREYAVTGTEQVPGPATPEAGHEVTPREERTDTDASRHGR